MMHYKTLIYFISRLYKWVKIKNREVFISSLVKCRHMKDQTTAKRATWTFLPRLYLLLAVFILEDALSVWTNLGKHLLLVWLFVCSIKTGTRRIIRLDKLFSVVRRSRRITEDNSSTRIMHLVPVFILETNNQTSNKCLPKFVQTDNASSSIKTAIFSFKVQ